jgi:hypothetical protein
VLGFGELDLEAKANVVGAVVFIAVAAFIAYATVQQLRLQKQLHKRMGLGDDPAGS